MAMRADLLSLVGVTVAVALFAWAARPAPLPLPPAPAASLASTPLATQSVDPYAGFLQAARAGMKLKSGFNGVAGLLLVLKDDRFTLIYWGPSSDHKMAEGRYQVHGREVRLIPGQERDIHLHLTNWEPYRLDLVKGNLPGVEDAESLMPLWEERIFKPAQ